MHQENNSRESVKPSPSDEIDLREVFSSIGNLLSRMGLKLVHFILALRRVTLRYRILIVATIILFAGLGILWHSKEKSYYSSSMVIESEFYDQDLLDGVISEINALAEEKAYAQLERKLHISNEEAVNLRALSVKAILTEDDRLLLEAFQSSVKEKKMTVEEMVSMRNLLVKNNYKYLVTVEVFSNEQLKNIQNGIMEFLEANKYVQRRIKIEEENLKSLRGKLHEERAKLDHLKGLVASAYTQTSEKGRTGSNNVILGAAETSVDPLNVYKEDIKLYNEELSINKRLALMGNVEVIKGFTAFSKPSNRSLAYVLGYSVLVGLFAAYSIILLLELNNALNRFEKNRERKNSYA